MNRRLPLILVALLAVQLVILLLGRGQNRLRPMFPNFKPDDAVTITIIKPDNNQVTLKKQDKTWNVPALNGVEADPSAVKALLKDIGAMSTGVVQSKRPDKFPTYGVAEPKAESNQISSTGLKPVPPSPEPEPNSSSPEIKPAEEPVDPQSLGVTVKVMGAGDKPLVTFIAGKSATNDYEMYLRLPGSKEVYRVNRNLRRLIDRSADEWRDWYIISLDDKSRDRIKTLSASSQVVNANVRMTRNPQGIWELELAPQASTPSQPAVTRQMNKLAIMPDKAAPIISALAMQRSADFPAPEDPGKGFDRPTLDIKFTMLDGEEYGYLIGEFRAQDRKFYARKMGSNTVFLLSEGTFDWMMDQIGNLEPKFKDLKPPKEEPKPAPQPNPGPTVGGPNPNPNPAPSPQPR